VDADLVVPGIHAIPQLGGASVDSDATIADELLACATGAEARRGQHTLQPYRRHRRGIYADSSSRAPSWGARGGRDASESSPRRSRNSGVVAYRRGRPGASSRPASATTPRSTSARRTPSESTPRIAAIWCRVTGCL